MKLALDILVVFSVFLIAVSLFDSWRLFRVRKQLTDPESKKKVFIVHVLNCLFLPGYIVAAFLLVSADLPLLIQSVISGLLLLGSAFVLFVFRLMKPIFKEAFMQRKANQKTALILEDSRYDSLEAMELYSALAQVSAFVANEINNPLFNLGVETDRTFERSTAFCDSVVELIDEFQSDAAGQKELKQEIDELKASFLKGHHKVKGYRNQITQTVKEIRGITGADGFAMGQVDIISLIQQVIDSENIKASLESNSIQYALLTQSEHEECQCYQVIIRRAILLLTKSAIHYSLKSENPRIEIEAVSAESYVKLLFKNNGPTIPAARAEELFKLNKLPQQGGHSEHLGMALINKLLSPMGSIFELYQNDTTWVTLSLKIPRRLNSQTFKSIESLQVGNLKQSARVDT